MELRYIGGVYAGNIKSTPFLCLILKMLQIQPQKDIVIEFIRNEDFKYVRALEPIICGWPVHLWIVISTWSRY